MLRSVKPFGDGKLLNHLWDNTVEDKLDGTPYRKGATPTIPSIYRPDEYTLIVVTGNLLPRMLKNHALPEDDWVTNVLGGMDNMPDFTALLRAQQ